MILRKIAAVLPGTSVVGTAQWYSTFQSPPLPAPPFGPVWSSSACPVAVGVIVNSFAFGFETLVSEVSSTNVPAAVAAAVVVVAVGGVCFGSGSLHTAADWTTLGIRPGGASGK